MDSAYRSILFFSPQLNYFLLRLCLSFFLLFYIILKVTFHLQLLQNIGYILCFVQYILEPILHAIVCTSCSPTPYYPYTPSPVVTTSLLSISVSASFLLYSLVCCIFFFFLKIY